MLVWICYRAGLQWSVAKVRVRDNELERFRGPVAVAGLWSDVRFHAPNVRPNARTDIGHHVTERAGPWP